MREDESTNFLEARRQRGVSGEQTWMREDKAHTN